MTDDTIMTMLKRGSLGLLVAWIATVASLDAAGEPSLALAVKNRDEAAATALLQQRADVNLALPDGATALHWAVHWNDPIMVGRLIRAGANVNAANRFGATPLWMACSEGNNAMVEALVTAGADATIPALGGEPVLMTAAQAGSVPAVKALLAYGADVNATEPRHGQTALMWAVGGRDTYPDVARVLLEHGADVTVRSDGGMTPLLFAVRQGDLEAVRLLVTAGADVNDRAVLPDGRPMAIFGDSQWSMPSADTSSALTLAVTNGHYEIATVLLENGAGPNVANAPFPYRTPPNISISREALKPGFASLHALVARRTRRAEPGSLEAIKTMIAHGADVNARTPSVKAPVPSQLNPQPIITWVQVGGITPFWIAANALDIEAMRLLVENGADPKLKNMEDTTPLMVAAGLGIKSRGPSGGLGRRADWNVDALRLLLELGNDVNAVNVHGQTALHAAAFAAAHPAVQFLFDHGARTDLKDEMGRTPLDVAHDNLRVEYRPALQRHKPEDIQATIDLLETLSQR